VSPPDRTSKEPSWPIRFPRAATCPLARTSARTAAMSCSWARRRTPAVSELSHGHYETISGGDSYPDRS